MKKTVTKLLSCIALFVALSGQFNFLQAQQANLTATSNTIAKNAAVLGLSANDLRNYRISDAYIDKASGATLAYLQQTWKGVDVFNAIKTVSIKNDRIYSVAGTYITDINTAINVKDGKPKITAADAVKATAAHFSLPAPVSVTALKKSANESVFGELNISSINVKARLLWLPDDKDKAALTWQVEIQPLNRQDYWLVNVDAMEGTVISKISLTVNCDWHHTVADNGSEHVEDAMIDSDTTGLLQEDAVDTTKLPDSAAYRVVPFPAESPTHPGGAPAIRTNPWLLAGTDDAATPYKWYADSLNLYDSSRSNNVLAQEDVNGNNNFGKGAHSKFKAPKLLFNYVPNFNQDPVTATNQQFAITNLFYWNNIMHDVLYQYGFNEVSGNFQRNNLKRGGRGNDYVLADAQDGGGTNNANFATPSDGSNPRMQMYLWSAVPTVKIMKPAAFKGNKTAAESAFSTNNKLADKGPITGNVILVNDDATKTTHFACGTLFNPSKLAGKIALIDRGNCDFVVKVKSAQNAGAIAAIVVNNVPGSPITMGGTDNTITIPAVMISQATGDTMKQYLALDSVVTTTLSGGVRIDGDLDNSIIAHEYTHGISNRLTGGPLNVSCLFNSEQAGEGWSDYLALMVITDWSKAKISDGPNKRPIGTYARGQLPDGSGIRTYPYSTNITVDPWTYADMKNSGGEPHVIGEIWCTAVWEMTWDIIQQLKKINPSIYSNDGKTGNSVALQLVMEGMKLQPCSPGFIDARNGILKADTLLYSGKYSAAIWKAFAKRGMGVFAKQGSSFSTTDQVADFTEPTPQPFVPIAKNSFNATKQNNTAVLNWSNIATSSTAAITIERSTDGRTFSAIGNASAAGNTFTDKNPQNGTNTYRLLQTDLTGNKIYSEAHALSFNLITITPNPAKDVIAVTVSGNNKPLSVTLSGNNGQKIAVYVMNSEFKQINLPRLTAGIYNVSITGEGVLYKSNLIIR